MPPLDEPVPHPARSPLRGLARSVYGWVTDKHPREAAEMRQARLLTLTDSPLVFTLSAIWSQSVPWIALAVTGQRWILALIGADLLVHAWRLVLRRRYVLAVATQRRPPDVWYVLACTAWFSLLAAEIAAAITVHDIRLANVASSIAVGFSGFIASRFAAFPRLGFAFLVMLSGGLTLGLWLSTLPDLWMVALITPGVAPAFFVLMMQNRGILLTALRSEQENRRLSLHDPLTGLPNRSMLRERLSSLARGPTSNANRLAVLCLDLDGFKAVNDHHGHAGGDWLLKTVAERMRAILRVQDLACRIGGDEFVVVLPGADRASAIHVAERLLASIAQPYDLGKIAAVRVGASVGIAIHRDGKVDQDGLLSLADDALYKAKGNGKGSWCVAS